MSVAHGSVGTKNRATIAVLVLFNVALMPLFANLAGVISESSGFDRTYEFQTAVLILAMIVVVLRRNLNVGITLNAAAVVAAATALFRSPEPPAYITYTGALLAVWVVLYGLIWALTGRRKERASPER